MKLYKGVDGIIRTYRADYKWFKLNDGVSKLVLPNFDFEILNRCLSKFARHYAHLLPDSKTNGSIYLRINVFEDTNTLEISGAGEATLSVIGSIVGPYYAGTRKHIKVRVETERMKNFDGSLAYVKSSANYAPTHLPDAISSKMGYDTTLWLYNHLYLAELSVGNIFMVLKEGSERKVITPPAKYILFPGSFRDAIITMIIDWEIPFEERLVPICDVKQLIADGKILEMFSTGHYVMVTPIVEINYKNE
ncbi:hypothetical protein B4U79_17027, partial [Dinothrombium tinctorium]